MLKMRVSGILPKLDPNTYEEKSSLRSLDHLICNHFSEKCSKVVREKLFENSGLRNLVQEKWLIRKKGGFIP